MHRNKRLSICFAFIVVGSKALAQTPNCDFASLASNTTSITSTQVEAGQLRDVATLPAAAPDTLPTFCRVRATLKPTSDSNIKVEVWLPTKNWNGRLQSVGNGGLAGSLSYAAMATALKEGYATASTDTGHTGSPVNGSWALNHPEKIIDFGHRAVHEMTVLAKAAIKQYYGKPQHHAYWNGCSEGGNQALHEAQRYPDDYDGIVAGAPANYMTHLQAGGLGISLAIHKDPATFIAPSKLPAINAAVLAACDEKDGLKDGIVDDPRKCSLDFANLQCKANETDQCLTAPQIAGLRKVYAGIKDPRSDEIIFPGYSIGSELEWNTWIAGTESPPVNRQHAIAESLFKFMVFNDASWDWTTFDFRRDVALADQRVGNHVNSINPDLLPFKKRGGKLLQYHGWYDPAISPLNSIDYFTTVQKEMGDSKDFYRLFMLPGVAHCGGGPGAAEFNRMDAIVQWVESNRPPDNLLATRKLSATSTLTRPLCAYPEFAQYKGSGDINVATNFVCKRPKMPVVEQAAKPKSAAPKAAPTPSTTTPTLAAKRQMRVDNTHYSFPRNHDPDGIGKFYMGREIAQVMGPGGILWLERDARETEEQPAAVIDALALKGGETVVDFGAGSGYYTFRLARAVGPKGTVLAVDVESKMLEFIRKRAVRENLFNVGLLQSTADDPRLPANRVDLLLMVDVYHELEFPREVISKISEALKPSGRVVLVEYREEDPTVAIKRVHKMSKAQIEKEMNAVGLSLVSTVDTLPIQHLMIFEKSAAN